jgi:hypothetical protein
MLRPVSNQVRYCTDLRPPLDVEAKHSCLAMSAGTLLNLTATDAQSTIRVDSIEDNMKFPKLTSFVLVKSRMGAPSSRRQYETMTQPHRCRRACHRRSLMVAPKGTPAALVNLLKSAANIAEHKPQVVAQMQLLGAYPVGGTLAEARA